MGRGGAYKDFHRFRFSQAVLITGGCRGEILLETGRTESVDELPEEKQLAAPSPPGEVGQPRVLGRDILGSVSAKSRNEETEQSGQERAVCVQESGSRVKNSHPTQRWHILDTAGGVQCIKKKRSAGTDSASNEREGALKEQPSNIHETKETPHVQTNIDCY